MEQATILVVDPDKESLKSIGNCLRKEGYTTVTAVDGHEAIEKSKLYHPNLLILEINLPDIDGVSICTTVRNSSNAAIIVLSSKSGEADRIASFKAGADDYLTKPCSNRELMARVKAVMRRVHLTDVPCNQVRLHFPSLVIDRIAHQVRTKNGSINLTKKELNILWFLASNPGKVFSRKEILNEVWGEMDLVDMEEVTVMISRLRDKIESDLNDPRYITTVWGVGYKFEPKL